MLTNTPPDATDDINGASYTVFHNETLEDPRSVLDNDHDADFDPFTAQFVSGPSNAQTFNLNSDGTFTYKAIDDWAGIDGFTYAAFDGTNTDEAAVTIHVENFALMPEDDVAYLVQHDTLVAEGVLSVLYNDHDNDGDELTAIVDDGPAHAGSFNLNPDGSFSYTPQPGYVGLDSFTYMAHDGIEPGGPAYVELEVWNFTAEAEVSQNQDPACQCVCICGPALEIDSASGNVALDLGAAFGLPKGVLPVYSSLTVDSRPIVKVKIPFASTLPDFL